MADDLDNLLGSVDENDVPKNLRRLGLITGPKRTPKELEKLYGGPCAEGTGWRTQIEFEELE